MILEVINGVNPVLLPSVLVVLEIGKVDISGLLIKTFVMSDMGKGNIVPW
jgi:hypothetical protein